MMGYLPICSWSSNFTRAPYSRAPLESRPRSMEPDGRVVFGQGTDERGDVLQELGLLVRLAEEGVNAELRGLVAVLVRGARRDDDDRDAGGARVATHVPGQVEAVHARHLDVDQHDRRDRVLELLQRVDAVLRR